MASDQENQKIIAQLKEDLRQKDLELARYRQELSRANMELEKIIADFAQELKMAGQIQRILSPIEIPNIQGIEFSTKFIPGTERGGDYFDIFEHEDKMKFGIVLACSSGYSMSALFLSVLIKLSAQIEARRGLSPDQVLIQMAKELVPHIQNKDFASVFYGIVDRRAFELTYSSAGKIYGFLQVSGQEGIARLEPSAGLFNKDFNERPLAQKIQLNARDRLILCSEGIVQAQNPSGEQFGVERLEKALYRAVRSGVHDVRNEILYQVEQFTGLSDPTRDLTVVVTEVKDRVIKLAKNKPV
ncbi:MAG: hypothetical protein BroJett040_04760 [Oligoflexia bacterium]|nr:MAG: hypothetical protein BroJett040_04760 [Oligoflexia bacterium]